LQELQQITDNTIFSKTLLYYHLSDTSHQAKAMEMQINTHLQFLTSLTTAHLTLFLDLKQRSRIQESSAPLLFFATEMGLKIS
jgi:hypothetical protein